MLTTDQAPNGERPRRKRRLIETILFTAVWLSTAAAATTMRAYSIPSASMDPTLTQGDRVLALTTGVAGEPKRGEVWVFRSPVVAQARGVEFVKRVVAVPGDTVGMSGGKLVVNGVAVTEPYLLPGRPYTVAPLTLGPDQYYVLGDNRANSNDSHVFGPISRSAFVGRVQVRYWPPARIGGL